MRQRVGRHDIVQETFDLGAIWRKLLNLITRL